ncbi:hypothetical protein SRABI112_05323 [Pseudomonas mediterranea]|nr:hypothetical protein SRABI112_05323 [Pseudomonas mediterranea]
MPKYSCVCGYVMNLSQGWSDYEFTLIPESTIEDLGDRLDGENNLSSDQLYEALDEKAITVYRCPKCKRLHLEEEPNKFTTYIVE